VLHNDEISELLLRAAADEEGHRRRALERAAKASWTWEEEAASLVVAGRSLTELRTVGPWVGELIERWLDEQPEVPEPDEIRRGFLTTARVRAVLDADPSWVATPHGDLQVHSTDSDGALPLEEMADAARTLGRAYIASTDHSSSLTIAHGMSPEEVEAQGRRIDAFNAIAAEHGPSFRVLRSMEMDVFTDGSGDMDPDVLATLDLVLGAFHTKLRDPNDATERYLAALRNPSVHVLAHPTTRMFLRRRGLIAEWPRVFAEAARLGKAIELDGTPRRQDLPVELAQVALAEGVEWFSMGSDAHNAQELSHLPIAMATAALAGIPRERILNYRTANEVIAWAADLPR
jgi:histidinol phosphatase-like PHP family hydrolase